MTEAREDAACPREGGLTAPWEEGACRREVPLTALRVRSPAPREARVADGPEDAIAVNWSRVRVVAPTGRATAGEMIWSLLFMSCMEDRRWRITHRRERVAGRYRQVKRGKRLTTAHRRFCHAILYLEGRQIVYVLSFRHFVRPVQSLPCNRGKEQPSRQGGGAHYPTTDSAQYCRNLTSWDSWLTRRTDIGPNALADGHNE